jgi:hypothetical protein
VKSHQIFAILNISSGISPKSVAGIGLYGMAKKIL